VALNNNRLAKQTVLECVYIYICERILSCLSRLLLMASIEEICREKRTNTITRENTEKYASFQFLFSIHFPLLWGYVAPLAYGGGLCG